MAEDYGAAVNEWVNVVRRARLDRTTKLVALTLATYADPDGTNVFPGLARLVVQCDVSYATAQRALRTLRDAELVQIVKRGNRRRGRSDEYRLILGANLLERITVHTPDEERDAIDEVAGRRAADYRQRYRDGLVHRYETTRDGRNHTSQVKRDDGITPHQRPESHLTHEAPPSIETSPNSDVRRVDPPSIPSAPGSTAVDRDGSAHAGTANAARDLDLAQTNGWKDKPRRRPWSELQHRYEAGEVGEEYVEEFIASMVGPPLDGTEQTTVLGMLASGAHIKAIYNKISADRRTL